MDQATVVTQLVVSLTFLPLMRHGSSFTETLATLASGLLDKEKGLALREPGEADPVLVIAISEILEIASFMCLLCDDTASIENVEKVVDSVMSATAGVKQTMKRSVLQCNSFKIRAGNIKQSCQAELTIRPEMDAWKQRFESEGTAAVLEEGLAKVPLWQDKLRGGLHHMLSI